MNIKPILHIPHSSINIPHIYREDFTLTNEILQMHAKTLADLYTDEIYTANQSERVIAEVSRIVVDVERFREDNSEPMSNCGMGAIYEKGIGLQSLQRIINKERKEQLLQEIYDPHHQELEATCAQSIEKHDKALIIDCHSFPSYGTFHQSPMKNCPEICLGTDPYHTPEPLVNYFKKAFLDHDYRVEINHPFKGALVPLKYYNTDPRVHSIMIEIRRDLYMNEENFEKIDKFNKLCRDIHTILDGMPT